MSVLGDLPVLSFEQYGAGPYATMHLAELGADVIKIEKPGEGDMGRQAPVTLFLATRWWLLAAGAGMTNFPCH